MWLILQFSRARTPFLNLSDLTFSGWGSTYPGSPDAKTLQQAELPIAKHDECSKTNGHIFPVVEEQMLCAGGNGKVGTISYSISTIRKSAYVKPI